MNQLIGGRLRFEADGSPAPILDRLELLLGLRWGRPREDDHATYYFGSVLGLDWMLEVPHQGPPYAYLLTYSSQAGLYDPPAEVVTLDFHVVRLLAMAGIASQPSAE